MKEMSKTVDWGIDLGTTNSAVARMTNKGPEIIPVRRMNYIPSAVARDKRGDLKVGTDALNVHVGGARHFKRLMGTGNTHSLGGEIWTPEELSSEVLKALRSAAKLKTNEDIEDVVITVPAMFSQPQCAATNEAARLAGLNAVALLQEPIAAATAYLSQNPADGHYLIYDLGGGTFDVSLIKLQRGEMSVIEHGGDNYLGGVDFDRAVLDWVLDQIDRKGGDTQLFSDGWQRTQLFQACEEARVAVSEGDTASIYLDEFDLPIAKIELTRERAQDLVSDLVTRTIDISRDRIRTVRSGVRAVLLVGGPTQMPYIRGRLSDELGFPLGLEQDPMTVVAEGAAVHAGTILRRSSGPVEAAVNAAQLQLAYEPVSPDENTSVAGRITEPREFKGEIRLTTTDGGWESGWRTLANGAFTMDLNLGRRPLTEFKIALRDLQGREIPTEPASFTIRSGVRAAQPVAPYNYGVVRQGSKLGTLIRAGDPLPASGHDSFHLAKTLVAGSPDEAAIYFVEGNSSFPDENVRVGSFLLRGTELRRTLREGERIEVRMKMDESRRLRADIYIPVLDEDHKVELLSFLIAPDVDDLAASVAEVKTAMSQMEGRATEAEQETVMRADRQLEVLEATLERVEKGEVGEAERVQKQLADVKASIRPLRDKYGLQAKHEELVELLVEAESLCQHFQDRMGLSKMHDAREDADKALRMGDDKALESVFDRVRDTFWEHYGKTRDCWEHQVNLMRERAGGAVDALAYHEHTRQAERALAENDFEGVRLHALRAFHMLPDREKFKDRFYDAALR